MFWFVREPGGVRGGGGEGGGRGGGRSRTWSAATASEERGSRAGSGDAARQGRHGARRAAPTGVRSGEPPPLRRIRSPGRAWPRCREPRPRYFLQKENKIDTLHPGNSFRNLKLGTSFKFGHG